MVEIKCDSKGDGNIYLADEVIAVIAGTAALEVEGVASTGGYITNDLVGRIGGKKNFSKGVKVLIEEEAIKIDLNLTIIFGYKVQDISLEVQKKVKNAVETMTGLTVDDVNVNVMIVNFDKVKKKEKEFND